MITNACIVVLILPEIGICSKKLAFIRQISKIEERRSSIDADKYVKSTHEHAFVPPSIQMNNPTTRQDGDHDLATAEKFLAVSDNAEAAGALVDQSWEIANSLYEDMKSSDIDPQTLSNVASVAGNVVSAIFPALLEIGKTVRFVGLVAAIGLQFYQTGKQYLHQNKDIKEIAALVQDSVLWFKQMGSTLQRLLDGNISEMKKHLRELVHAIHEALP
jgi:hypothetical protein